MAGSVSRDAPPRSTEEDRSLADWVAEMVDHLDTGDVDLATYSAAHPEHAERLKELLPAIEMMASLRRRSEAGSGCVLATSESQAFGTLGDFRTVRVLGRGGMGVVYEAVQVSLNRRVALKILPTVSAEDPRRLKRFQIEAQAAACLHHPHIVPVYVVGSEGGVHFYAMQLIEGQTLAEVIAGSRPQDTANASTERENAQEPRVPAPPPAPVAAVPDRLSPRAVADLGRQAAEALHYAHEQGIIHRDVKPSNLLIDGSGTLWVADFGLARMPGDGDLTATGVLLGTLRYMSPEQALGSRRVVDHRADIYSLGATLYELITLQPAFDGDDRLELLRRIADEEPRPPQRVDASIPLDLATIVLKAMAKDPSERYPTARELAQDLSRFLEHRPILARPPSVLGRAVKWSRRHKSVVATAAVLLIAGVLGLAGAVSWRYGMLRRHNQELSTALDLAERHESSVRQLLYGSQIRLAQQEMLSGKVEFAQEILEGLRPPPGGRDIRGFEWSYLHRLSHREFSLLFGHERPVFALALSPDGRTLVSGDTDGIIIFWDLVAWKERHRIRGHLGEVNGLAFSPDGRTFVSWSMSEGGRSDVKLWDSRSAREVATVLGIEGHVDLAGFSGDGRVLVYSERDLRNDRSKNKAIFLDLSSGRPRIIRSPAPLECVHWALSPDGQWVATAGLGGPVTLRETTNGRVRTTLAASPPQIDALAVSARSGTVAVKRGGNITFVDATSAAELNTVPDQDAFFMDFSPHGTSLAVRSLSRDGLHLINDVRANPRPVPLEGITGRDLRATFSPDGRKLAATGVGFPATLWDASTGRTLAELPRKTGGSLCLVFTHDGQSLFFTSDDFRIICWRFEGRVAPIDRLAGHKAEVWALAYSPDGTVLASASDDHLIKLWDPRTGALLSDVVGNDALVTSLAFSPDGQWLASGSFDNTVRLWDIPGGRPRRVLRGHTRPVRTVAISPDGRYIASASDDKTIRLWDVASGKQVQILEGHRLIVYALAFAPDGTFLVSSANDRTLKVWELPSGRLKRSIDCQRDQFALAFSSSGDLLASGDEPGHVTLWDVATWSTRRTLKGSHASVRSLSFSPDGRTLAAACDDAKVRLWDPIAGQMTLVLDGHAVRVNAVAFSPDGSTLASASHDGAVRLWQAGQPDSRSQAP